VRGDVHRLRSPRGGRGHEQAGACFAVVVPVRLVATVHLARGTHIDVGSAGELPSQIVIAGATTRVLAEQTAAVDPERLGERAGHLTTDELQRVDAALRIVLEL